jgi:hypothetical protein
VTEQLVDDSCIAISYMAVSESAANDFRTLLLANIPLITPTDDKYSCDESSHVIEDGTTHSFYKSIMYVSGDPMDILLALDDIKAGSLFESMDMIHKFSVDSIYTYLLFNDQEELLSSVSYLHSNAQSNYNEIHYLQQDYNEMKDIVNSQQKQIEILSGQYAVIQSFLHSYIDIIKLKEVVVELAEKVDKDLLDTFRVIQVH